MVPTFTSVSLTLKGLIEEQIDSGGSKINLNPYISKATLDIIGLVGENYRKKQKRIFYSGIDKFFIFFCFL